jgi:hypothetical protein
MWLKKFVPGLEVIYNMTKPPKSYCDNKVTVVYSYNNKSSAIVKYIGIKYSLRCTNISRFGHDNAYQGLIY